MALEGAVVNNMVSMISCIAIIDFNYYLLLNKVWSVLYQSPQNSLDNRVTIIILSYVECVIGTYILGCVHGSALP